VHAEETLAALDRLLEPVDVERRRVGGDHGVLGRRGLDRGVDLELDAGVLGDRLEHEVGAVDRLGGAVGGLDRLDALERLVFEQAGVDVAARSRDHGLAGLLGELGRGVGDADLQPGDGEGLGDAAAHAPGADDRDPPRPGGGL
jgi:hypothetical protein